MTLSEGVGGTSRSDGVTAARASSHSPVASRVLAVSFPSPTLLQVLFDSGFFVLYVASSVGLLPALLGAWLVLFPFPPSPRSPLLRSCVVVVPSCLARLLASSPVCMCVRARLVCFGALSIGKVLRDGSPPLPRRACSSLPSPCGLLACVCVCVYFCRIGFFVGP